IPQPTAGSGGTSTGAGGKVATTGTAGVNGGGGGGGQDGGRPVTGGSDAGQTADTGNGTPPVDGAVTGPSMEPACVWPTPASDQKVSATIAVAKLLDGGMKRYLGDGALATTGQAEGQKPLF